MQKYKSVFFIILILNLVSCTKNPCDGLDNGVYVYPEVKGKSFTEAIELYKIPESILDCISTQGLINSCIYYPEMRLIWTHSHLQGGFDKVEAMCNGFEELWKREDKYTELMALYKGLNFERDWDAFTNLENGRYLSNIVKHELILAQNEILLEITKTQKIALFQYILEIQNLKFNEFERYGHDGMESSVGILSRIMYNDNYLPLIKEYENNELLQIHINFFKILDLNIINNVMSLSEDYLKILQK